VIVTVDVIVVPTVVVAVLVNVTSSVDVIDAVCGARVARVGH